MSFGFTSSTVLAVAIAFVGQMLRTRFDLALDVKFPAASRLAGAPRFPPQTPKAESHCWMEAEGVGIQGPPLQGSVTCCKGFDSYS